MGDGMVDGELDLTGVSDLRDVSVLKRDVKSLLSEEGSCWLRFARAGETECSISVVERRGGV